MIKKQTCANQIRKEIGFLTNDFITQIDRIENCYNEFA